MGFLCELLFIMILFFNNHQHLFYIHINISFKLKKCFRNKQNNAHSHTDWINAFFDMGNNIKKIISFNYIFFLVSVEILSSYFVQLIILKSSSKNRNKNYPWVLWKFVYLYYRDLQVDFNFSRKSIMDQQFRFFFSYS